VSNKIFSIFHEDFQKQLKAIFTKISVNQFHNKLFTFYGFLYKLTSYTIFNIPDFATDVGCLIYDNRASVHIHRDTLSMNRLRSPKLGHIASIPQLPPNYHSRINMISTAGVCSG